MTGFNDRKRRRVRQDVTAFQSLIASPETGSFTMPAGGRLKIVATAGCSRGTVVATLTGVETRNIGAPLLAAGGSMILDHVESGVEVTPVASFDIYVDTGLGVFRAIATP
jgi:hypothetical protein